MGAPYGRRSCHHSWDLSSKILSCPHVLPPSVQTWCDPSTIQALQELSQPGDGKTVVVSKTVRVSGEVLECDCRRLGISLRVDEEIVILLDWKDV